MRSEPGSRTSPPLCRDGPPRWTTHAALLGRAWGLSREWVIKAVMQSGYYFGGIDVLEVAHIALGDVLDRWE